MDEYNCYDKIIKSILKYKKNEKYDILISIFLNKMYYEYYMNKNLKEYNLDDLNKKIFTNIVYIYLSKI